MKLDRIVFKIFISNYKQIRLFGICNILLCTIVHLFVSISTNDSFMNSYTVDTMISYNIYLPTAVILVFIIFFVPYSQRAFLKLQQYNFGVIAALGIKTVYLYALQAAECLCMIAFSLIGGLFTGTILHVIMFIFLSVVFNTDFTILPSLDSYKVVIVIYACVFMAGLCINFVLQCKDQINQWIYGIEKRKSKLFRSFATFLYFVGGALAIIVSMAVMQFYNEEKNDLWVYSMPLCLAGLYLILSGARVFLRTVQKRVKKTTPFFVISIIGLHYKEIKKVVFMAVVLIQFSVFFLCLAVSNHRLVLRNAISYTPFHMQYIEMNGYNMEGEETVKNLCDEYDIQIEETQQLEFLRNTAVNIFAVSDINKIFSKEFNIKPGEFVILYQYASNDGYGHERFPVRNLSVKGTENREVPLVCAGEETDILFNKNHALADRTIIVNDLDYERLEEIIPASLHGKILMYRFQEWEKAEPVIQGIMKYFNEQNKIEDLHDMLFYSMSSRMEEVNKANESGFFLIILSLVILCLFYMAANIILYYSQKINMDKTKEFYTKLYFIGMKQKNIMKLEHVKNCVIFIVPGLFSTFSAIVYSYSVNKIYLMGNMAALLAGCVIMIIILMQFAVACLYTKKEYFFA